MTIGYESEGACSFNRIPADLSSASSMASGGDASLSGNFDDIANSTLTLSGLSGMPLTLSAANLVINGQVVDVKPSSGGHLSNSRSRSSAAANIANSQNRGPTSGGRTFLDTGDCYIDDELTGLSWLRERNILQNTTPLDSLAVEAALRDVAALPPPPPSVPRRRGLPKPPFSFSTLIFMAIEKSPEKRLPVKDIYAWILNNFPYFRFAPSGWRNSVRHNLSLNRCFMKIQKDNSLFNSKGSLWCVDPVFRPNLLHALKRVTLQPYGQYPHYNSSSPIPPFGGDDLGLGLAPGIAGNDEITDVDVANALMEMKSSVPRAIDGSMRARYRRWTLKQAPEDHTYSAEDQGAEPIASSGETESEPDDENQSDDDSVARSPKRRKTAAGRKRSGGAVDHRRKQRQPTKRGRPAKAKKQMESNKPKRQRKSVPKKVVAVKEEEDFIEDEEEEEEEDVIGDSDTDDNRALALLADADEDEIESEANESEEDDDDQEVDESEEDMDEGADAEMAEVLKKWRDAKNAAAAALVETCKGRQVEGDVVEEEIEVSSPNTSGEQRDSGVTGSWPASSSAPSTSPGGELNSSGDTDLLTASSGVSGRSSRGGSARRKSGARPIRSLANMDETIAAARARPEPEVIRPSVGVIRSSSNNRVTSVQTRSRQPTAPPSRNRRPGDGVAEPRQRLSDLIAMFRSTRSREASEASSASSNKRPHQQLRQSAATRKNNKGKTTE